MARTRLRQLEQIRNTIAYDDLLNMGPACEGQAGDNIGSNNAIVENGDGYIVVAEDLTILGANVGDDITIAGSAANDGTYKITAISYTAPNSTVTIAGTPLTPATADGNAQVTVDSTKNLARDLNFIRTQLRKLNQTDDWYDEPVGDAIAKYEVVTGSPVTAGTDIILSGSETFDAGEPYTFKVYLNGQLLMPSTVSSNVVTVSYDYTEKDVSGPVGSLEVGDRVAFNFNIVAEDIIQFKWTKK